jgi:acyl carrier protein phosphodiesterase
MNYLAHLFLADPTPESLLGNLAGDFVKGALGDRFTPGVRQGIMEHRRIDEFTDTHPSIAALRRVIGAEHGHYSRVIADLFLDHFLSWDWEHYSLEDRDEFLRRIFGTLDPLIDEMPGHLRFVYPRMRDGRWLQSYIDPRGIETALRNLSHRFSREPHLETATHLLEDARDSLHAHATEFFPDVIAFAKRLR